MSYAYSSEPFLKTSTTTDTNPAFDMQRDFFEALTLNDVDRASNVFADNGVLLFPGLRAIEGRPIVRRMLGIIRRKYEHIAWLPMGPTISSNGWMVTTWSVTGRFVGTSVPYENEVLSLARLDQDGKIAILSDYFKDTLSFHPGRR